MKHLVLFLIVVLLCGCSAQRQGVTAAADTVERVVYRDRVQLTTDSIYLHDSIYVAVHGDTVYEYRLRDRLRDRIVRDTLLLADTVRVRTTVTQTVERALTWWQQTRLYLANVLLAALCAFTLCAAVRWLIKKYRK
jgi:hypothetical protein